MSPSTPKQKQIVTPSAKRQNNNAFYLQKSLTDVNHNKRKGY